MAYPTSKFFKGAIEKSELNEELLNEQALTNNGCPDENALNYDENWQTNANTTYGAFVCQYDYGCNNVDAWMEAMLFLSEMNLQSDIFGDTSYTFPHIVTGDNSDPGMVSPPWDQDTPGGFSFQQAGDSASGNYGGGGTSWGEIDLSSGAGYYDYLCDWICNPALGVDINPGNWVPAGFAGAEGYNFGGGSNQDTGLHICTCCQQYPHITYGCTDPNADNYQEIAGAPCDDENPSYTGDGCVEGVTGENCCCEFPGCTDETADNYDPTANIDDGSCTYSYGCLDPNATNYGYLVNIETGETLGDAPVENPEETLIPCEDGQIEGVNDGYPDCCIYPEGCTDPEALNFDDTAVFDDGSCEYPPPCFEFDQATFQDQNLGCFFFFDPTAAETYGLTDETIALIANYVNEGECCVLGCTDENSPDYDDTAHYDDGSCEYPGCTDETAINYDPGATVDDGSCEYDPCAMCEQMPEECALYCDIWFLGDPVSIDLYSEPVQEQIGVFLNYGECCDPYVEGCMDENAMNYSPEAELPCDDCCRYRYGCTDDTANNFDGYVEDGWIDDGSCEYDIPGCTDDGYQDWSPYPGIAAINYNPEATVDDGSCDYLKPCEEIEGWSDEGIAAVCGQWFGWQATLDEGGTLLAWEQSAYDTLGSFEYLNNGECCPEIVPEGCTDPTATNYDPNAVNDDGSCEYYCAVFDGFSANEQDVFCAWWEINSEDTEVAGYEWIASTLENGDCCPRYMCNQSTGECEQNEAGAHLAMSTCENSPEPCGPTGCQAFALLDYDQQLNWCSFCPNPFMYWCAPSDESIEGQQQLDCCPEELGCEEIMTEEWVYENIPPLNLIKGEVYLDDFCWWCNNSEETIVQSMLDNGIWYAQEACDCCPEDPTPDYDCDNFEQWIIDVVTPDWPGLATVSKFCDACEVPDGDIPNMYPGEPGCGCCPDDPDDGPYTCRAVQVSPTQWETECMEDPDGIYTTIEECQQAIEEYQLETDEFGHPLQGCPEPRMNWKCIINSGEIYGECMEDPDGNYTTEQECIDEGCSCPEFPTAEFGYPSGECPPGLVWNMLTCHCDPDEDEVVRRGCMDEEASNYMVCCPGAPEGCVPNDHQPQCCDYDDIEDTTCEDLQAELSYNPGSWESICTACWNPEWGNPNIETSLSTGGCPPEECCVDDEDNEVEEEYLYYGCSDCMEGEGNTYTSFVNNEGTDWLCGPEVIEVWLPNYQGPQTSTNSSNGFMYAGYPGQWLGSSESWTPEEVLEEQCTGTIGVVVNCRQCYDEWEANGNWMLPYCDNYNCPWPDDYTPDPEGAAAIDTADLSVDTPGAPQPEDYPLGGNDPQYLRDKKKFIKNYHSNNKSSLRESFTNRFQKLAGIKKKK